MSEVPGKSRLGRQPNTVALASAAPQSLTRDTVDVALETITIVKDFVPFEPARSALGAVCALLTLLQTYMQNADDLTDIAERCQRVALIIRKATESRSLDQDSDIAKAMLTLKNCVENIHAAILKKRETSKLRKAFRAVSDKAEIETLKASLRDFLLEFQIEIGIIGAMDVKAILEWVKQDQTPRQIASPSLYTPAKPAIFFGRDHLVKEIVTTILSGEHVALIGPGGIGKSSISKALLNEPTLASEFHARVFVSYDNTASSAMTYAHFLSRLSDALGLPSASTQKGILQRLESLTALVVIDNAETFMEASAEDFAQISQTLDAIGTTACTRIIITTRSHDTIPFNLICSRILVSGLSLRAACAAFALVYRLAPIDETIQRILTALDYHPLSINILANAAVINQWTPIQLETAWNKKRSRLLLSDVTKSKHGNLQTSIELSITCPVFEETRDAVLELLRAAAFLPQGIHRKDLGGTFLGVLAGQLADSLCRASLAYWLGDRLTLLAPIRLYVMDEYNHHLSYNDSVLSSFRSYYYHLLEKKPEACVLREYANINRVLLFDVSSPLYRSDFDVHLATLRSADKFLYSLYKYNPQAISFQSLLLFEATELCFKDLDDTVALALGGCLESICWLEHKCHESRAALGLLDLAESFCQHHAPICNRSLVQCLMLRGVIQQQYWSLASAEDALREGLSIAQGMNDSSAEALLKQSISGVALRRGNILEAKSLASSTQDYFESKNELSRVISIILHRSSIAIEEQDLPSARTLLEEAERLDMERPKRDVGRKRPHILYEMAHVEGRAGNTSMALNILDKILNHEEGHSLVNAPQSSHYVSAILAKAYYEGLSRNFDSARALTGRAIHLLSTTDVLYSNAKLVGVYIEIFAGNYRQAKTLLRLFLEEEEENPIQRKEALFYRALGEVALLEQRSEEGNLWFSKAKLLCDAMEMQPKLLYVAQPYHCTLPKEYDGWVKYLKRQ